MRPHDPFPSHHGALPSPSTCSNPQTEPQHPPSSTAAPRPSAQSRSSAQHRPLHPLPLFSHLSTSTSASASTSTSSKNKRQPQPLDQPRAALLHSPLLSLPQELLNLIATHIIPTTRLSFKLTCRALYTALSTHQAESALPPPLAPYSPSSLIDHAIHLELRELEPEIAGTLASRLPIRHRTAHAARVTAHMQAEGALPLGHTLRSLICVYCTRVLPRHAFSDEQWEGEQEKKNSWAHTKRESESRVLRRRVKSKRRRMERGKSVRAGKSVKNEQSALNENSAQYEPYKHNAQYEPYKHSAQHEPYKHSLQYEPYKHNAQHATYMHSNFIDHLADQKPLAHARSRHARSCLRCNHGDGYTGMQGRAVRVRGVWARYCMHRIVQTLEGLGPAEHAEHALMPCARLVWGCERAPPDVGRWCAVCEAEWERDHDQAVADEGVSVAARQRLMRWRRLDDEAVFGWSDVVGVRQRAGWAWTVGMGYFDVLQWEGLEGAGWADPWGRTFAGLS